MSGDRGVVHVWGFYDEAGRPRKPAGVALSEGTPHETFVGLRSHLLHHGGELVDLRTTRTLDGWLVGVEFDVPAHGGAATIWHQVLTTSEAWPVPGGDDL